MTAPAPGNDDRLTRLLEKARALPKVPGVYLLKDDKGVVLYVGKANVLPVRVVSYFVPAADHGAKKNRMLPLIEDFDVVECESEWEAMLAEARLIKDIHPRFNTAMTDGRSFPYLVVTMRDDFPGVFITREPAAERFKGAKVFGPFTSGYALRDSMKLLQRVFKFRTCELDIREDDERRRLFRPCLLYPIKQCSGPCAAKVSREAYRADIDRFVRFLESKRSVMIRELRREMEAAASAREYEKAAQLRDQMTAIEKLDERGKKSDGWQPEIESFANDPRKGLQSLAKTLGIEGDLRCIECIDIAHLQGTETVGSKVCFVDGRPLKDEYRKYKIRTAGNDDYMSIREVVSRAYRDAGADQQLYPDLVIIDGGAGQLTAAMEAFAQFEKAPPCVVALAKKEELIYTTTSDEPIRLGRNNLGLKLCQQLRDEAHRFAQAYHHVLRRKRVIGE